LDVGAKKKLRVTHLLTTEQQQWSCSNGQGIWIFFTFPKTNPNSIWKKIKNKNCSQQVHYV
jgi:hypothetical protein